MLEPSSSQVLPDEDRNQGVRIVPLNDVIRVGMSATERSRAGLDFLLAHARREAFFVENRQEQMNKRTEEFPTIDGLAAVRTIIEVVARLVSVSVPLQIRKPKGSI